MNRRAKIAAVLLSLSLCLGALGFLRAYGDSRRTMLSAPLVRQVTAQHEAFQVWKAGGVRGRTLVLIDRRLNADIDEPGYGFSRDEFSSAAQLERLCEALRSDLGGTGHEDFSCRIEVLNSEILDRLSLYPLLLRKFPAAPPDRIATLAGYLSLGNTFTVHLPGSSRAALQRFNRLVLEASYPNLCPQRPEYPVTPTTYVHQAVRAGIIRKIIHLISDSAWDEVSSVLGGSRFAESEDGAYRITIAEGVPVTILRFGDLPVLDEAALVNISTDSMSEDERARLPELLRTRLRSDLMTVSGSHAAATVLELNKAHGTDR